MYRNYQEQKEEEARRKKPSSPRIATINDIRSSGSAQKTARLRFNGETEWSQKFYPCNPALSWTNGQRVKVQKIGGTYYVESPI